ncbi:ArnT family glycosyltransferase [Oecophyllibacter saccharovorans]|uniref:Glycosyl transferase n=1 Tax=Oecophyllibacter saccharovorans TaxID=2558360 RepID=A0A506UKY5_9PROT|nr:glycosyltransferase family 39 protein [Oecophyllibacter saccharovorans]TPW34024.1 glycosyl transferase [Oecophyllibacter saccharovorans]
MPFSFPRRLPGRAYLLLGLLTFLLALAGRMTLPPLDRDEPRYMEATEQMVLSGNYLDIRFQEHPRYLQPAGIYWLEALPVLAAKAAFGPQALKWSWVYRLPSLLAASLAIPLTAWIGCAAFSAECGLLAAFFLLASTLFAAECRMATIDTTLLFVILCLEALLLSAWQALNRPSPVPLRTALLYWGALGCGLMLKGPIVLLPALGTPLLLGLTDRRFTLWRALRPGWGWLVSLAVVTPWCVCMALTSHGAFFRIALGHNLLGKIAHAQETHGFPPGYYLLLFVLTFWPGAWFTARALPQIWAHRHTPAVRFLLCWILPVWITFECLATKLPHYVLPAFPALAILTAASLTVWPPVRLPRWGKALLSVYGLFWMLTGLLLCSAGLLLLAHLHPSGPHPLSPPDFPAAVVLAFIGALLPLLASGLLILKGHLRQAACCAIGCAFITQTGIFLAVIPRLAPLHLSQRAADLFAANRPCPDSVLLSATDHEPSLVFLTGPATRLLTPKAAAQALKTGFRCDLALVDRKDEARFRQSLNALGGEMLERGRVSGLNYSNGHWLDLGLFSARFPAGFAPGFKPGKAD